MPKVIAASYEILSCPRDALGNIERAARTCYKSEHLSRPGSAKVLVRKLIERGHMAMIEFGGNITVRFTADRGFTHEAVRHRLCSVAQESTRYCNYSKKTFGKSITCVDTVGIMRMAGLDAATIGKAVERQLEGWLHDQQVYMDLLEMGVPPEIARNNLPIGVKAEIVLSANVREWRHVFNLRTSPEAHPRMRELMVPLLVELRRRVPVIFDDVGCA